MQGILASGTDAIMSSFLVCSKVWRRLEKHWQFNFSKLYKSFADTDPQRGVVHHDASLLPQTSRYLTGLDHLTPESLTPLPTARHVAAVEGGEATCI